MNPARSRRPNGETAGPSPSARLYRWLLHIYPAAHRRAYGHGMERTFLERAAAARRGGRLAFLGLLARELTSVAVHGVGQRLASLARRRQASSPPSGPQRPRLPSGPPVAWTSAPRLRWTTIVSATAQDVRHALRTLRDNAGFTAVVVATLALGIGADAAMFSVVNGVLLEPLPYEDADDLVALAELTPTGDEFTFSAANFRDLRAGATTLTDVILYDGVSLTLAGLGEAEQVVAVKVAAGFFELLGIELPLGRPFRPQDDTADAEPTVVLSYGEWRQRFAGDPQVLGRTVTLDGLPHTVIGVAPAGFEFLGIEAGFYVPWRFTGSDWDNRGGHMWPAFARLAGDASLSEARRELATIAARLGDAYPETNEGWGMTARSLRDDLVGSVQPMLLLLLAAVGLVLLVACVNVANLMLARSESRRREMAVRAALGAGGGRLVRQVLTESLLLAFAGAAAGVVFARWAVAALVARAGSTLPRAAEVGLDGTALVFTLGVAALAAVLVGLYPALRAGRDDVNAALRAGGRGSAGGRSTVRKALVVVETAMAVVLLVGAGLLVRSLWALQSVELGYEPEGTLTFRVRLPATGYAEQDEIAGFFERLEDGLRGLPGVEAVGSVGLLPLFASQSTEVLVGASEQEGSAQFRWVTPGYFEAMRMPLLRGRPFRAADSAATPLVTVVSQSFVDRYFPARDPIGERIRTFWDERPFEIVGVVGDVHPWSLEQPPVPTMYWAHAQFRSRSSMSTVIRTVADPFELTPTVRAVVARLDPGVPASGFERLADRVSRSLRDERFTALLLGVFAAVALILGAVGVYGVMAYSVNERRREVGVRMALGARGSQVVALVLRQGVGLTAIGIALGLAMAMALSGVLRRLLYGVSPADPATFALVAFSLAAVAVLACGLPARRAARVDPMVTLRQG